MTLSHRHRWNLLLSAFSLSHAAIASSFLVLLGIGEEICRENDCNLEGFLFASLSVLACWSDTNCRTRLYLRGPHRGKCPLLKIYSLCFLTLTQQERKGVRWVVEKTEFVSWLKEGWRRRDIHNSEEGMKQEQAESFSDHFTSRPKAHSCVSNNAWLNPARSWEMAAILNHISKLFIFIWLL